MRSFTVMTAHGLGRAAARLLNAAKPATSRAGAFAQNLKAEFEAGQALAGADSPEAEAVHAEEVAEAMRGVDWTKVRASTSARGSASPRC